MEVVIAGAGAMGLLIGTYLSEAGVSVSFFTKREEQAIELRDHGAIRVKDGCDRIFKVHAFSDLEQAPQHAFWILAVKSNDLRDLVNRLENSVRPAHLMFIQNGIRHYDLGKATSIQSVSVASLTHGARRTGNRTVVHNGVGVMGIAALKGNQIHPSHLYIANSSFFPMIQEQDGLQMLLKKAIINCCINPLTAILDLKNGELLTNRSAHHLMQMIHSELAAGYPEAVKTLPLSAVEAVCRKTSNNRSSMLTDRSHGVLMETDTIVSAILEGKEEMMPTLKTFELLLKAIDDGKEKS
ncbi:2-dehydropantoate 2-reductase [Sporosarcina gallistercoris]|uniref:ketopantoate reductase family protein n=1 Tax=Sporosarcina gallistercoris TaxID=2762245 RepID=UPI003D2AAA17